MWVTESCSTTISFWLKVVQLIIPLWFWLKPEVVQMYNVVLSQNTWIDELISMTTWQVLGCSTFKAYRSTMFKAIYHLPEDDIIHYLIVRSYKRDYIQARRYWGRDVLQGRHETTWSYHICLCYPTHVFSGRPCWIFSAKLHILLSNEVKLVDGSTIGKICSIVWIWFR